MRHLSTPDGLTIAVHELGAPGHAATGRPTLLCHATGFHGAVWEPLAAALGAGFDPCALDFRAHGASPVPRGHELDWAQFASDVLTVVDDLDVPPRTLLGVGHSMGGAALLLAEQARPGTFAGLWLYEPIAPPAGFFPKADRANPLADGAARRRPMFPSHEAAIANFAAKPPLHVLRADALHAYVRHGFVAGEDGAVHLACRPEDESQIYRGGGAHDAHARLAEVTCPVAVVCGRTEPGPALFAPGIAEALPYGRLEQMGALGHFGPLEAPGVCAMAVRRFATSL